MKNIINVWKYYRDFTKKGITKENNGMASQPMFFTSVISISSVSCWWLFIWVLMSLSKCIMSVEWTPTHYLLIAKQILFCRMVYTFLGDTYSDIIQSRFLYFSPQVFIVNTSFFNFCPSTQLCFCNLFFLLRITWLHSEPASHLLTHFIDDALTGSKF